MAIFELSEMSPVTRPTGPSTVEVIQSEIDKYTEEMAGFPNMEPGEVFLYLSAWSARMTELKIQLSRSGSQKAKSLVSREVDPLLEEIERQFRFHSRLQATRDWELKLSGGQV